MAQQASQTATVQPAQMAAATTADSNMQPQHQDITAPSASPANDDDTGSENVQESPPQNQPNSAIDEFSKYISNSPNRMDELKDYGIDLDIGISKIKESYNQLQKSVDEASKQLMVDGNKSSVINDVIVQHAHGIRNHVRNIIHPNPHDRRVNWSMVYIITVFIVNGNVHCTPKEMIGLVNEYRLQQTDSAYKEITDAAIRTALYLLHEPKYCKHHIILLGKEGRKFFMAGKDNPEYDSSDNGKKKTTASGSSIVDIPSPSAVVTQIVNNSSAPKGPYSKTVHRLIMNSSNSSTAAPKQTDGYSQLKIVKVKKQQQQQTITASPPTSTPTPAQTTELEPVDYEKMFHDIVQYVPIDAVDTKAAVLHSLSEARFVFNHYIDLLESTIEEKQQMIREEGVDGVEIEKVKDSLVGLEKKLKNFPKHINKLEALNSIIRKDPFAEIVPMEPGSSAIGDYYRAYSGNTFVPNENLLRFKCGYGDDRIGGILEEYDIYNSAFVKVKEIRRNINVGSSTTTTTTTTTKVNENEMDNNDNGKQINESNKQTNCHFCLQLAGINKDKKELIECAGQCGKLYHRKCIGPQVIKDNEPICLLCSAYKESKEIEDILTGSANKTVGKTVIQQYYSERNSGCKEALGKKGYRVRISKLDDVFNVDDTRHALDFTERIPSTFLNFFIRYLLLSLYGENELHNLELLNITVGLDSNNNDSNVDIIDVDGESGPPQQRLSAFNIPQMLKAQFSFNVFRTAVCLLQPPIKKSGNGRGYTASDYIIRFINGLKSATPAVLVSGQLEIEMDNKNKNNDATVSLTISELIGGYGKLLQRAAAVCVLSIVENISLTDADIDASESTVGGLGVLETVLMNKLGGSENDIKNNWINKYDILDKMTGSARTDAVNDIVISLRAVCVRQLNENDLYKAIKREVECAIRSILLLLTGDEIDKKSVDTATEKGLKKLAETDDTTTTSTRNTPLNALAAKVAHSVIHRVGFTLWSKAYKNTKNSKNKNSKNDDDDGEVGNLILLALIRLRSLRASILLGVVKALSIKPIFNCGAEFRAMGLAAGKWDDIKPVYPKRRASNLINLLLESWPRHEVFPEYPQLAVYVTRPTKSLYGKGGKNGLLNSKNSAVSQSDEPSSKRMRSSNGIDANPPS
ncbi:hypothetical protein GQ42DRAFT_160042 [Ramicandelaber brevisporus]|nr:hypothetical protein GQ42DRAFT_160042 [Ramicandelaber brevisporus]